MAKPLDPFPKDPPKTPKTRERWLSASVKLSCGCTFSIPVSQYFDYNPGDDAECSQHGAESILRASRLGTK